MKITEHSFNQSENYGYGECESKEDLSKCYADLVLNEIIPGIKDGICGFVIPS